MMISSTGPVTILVPANGVEPRRAERARRPASLRGLRLAVLANGKPDSDALGAYGAKIMKDFFLVKEKRAICTLFLRRKNSLQDLLYWWG